MVGWVGWVDGRNALNVMLMMGKRVVKTDGIFL